MLSNVVVDFNWNFFPLDTFDFKKKNMYHFGLKENFWVISDEGIQTISFF